MPKLEDLPEVSRAHWALHLAALVKDNPSNAQEISEYIDSTLDLPNINHPSYIHDWFENPEEREEIEGWE